MPTTSRNSLVALALTTSLWLICSASASATTFCAHSNVSCAGTPEATLGAAIAAAAANGPGRDTIKLPAGTFADAPVFDAVGNPVDIVGAGSDATVITSTVNGTGLTINEPTSTMSQLAVHATNTSGYTAISLGGTLDHVKVTGVATTFGGTGVSVDVSQTATIKHSTIDLDYGPNVPSTGVFAFTWSNVTISDSEIQAVTGVASQESTTGIERTRIWAEQGVNAFTGAYAFVRDSSIRTPGPAPHSGPEAAFKAWGAGPSEIDVISSTAYGDGDVGSMGVAVEPQASQYAVVSLLETAITHYAVAADVDSSVGHATLQSQWSAYEFARLTGNGNHFHSHDFDLTAVDPGFVDAVGSDLRLRANSPLVDAGDPVALTSGDQDRDGNPRVVDGGRGGGPRLDIGALEYQPAPAASGTPDPNQPAGAAADAPSGASGTSGGAATVAPLLSGLRLSPSVFHARGKTKLSFKLSQAAVVTVAVERAKGRKWIGVGSFKLKRNAGLSKVAFSGRVARRALRTGSYRMRLVARNKAGLGSKPAVAKFRIVR